MVATTKAWILILAVPVLLHAPQAFADSVVVQRYVGQQCGNGGPGTVAGRALWLTCFDGQRGGLIRVGISGRLRGPTWIARDNAAPQAPAYVVPSVGAGVWFADTTGQVGRAAPDGAIHIYHTPAAWGHVYVGGLAQGPDRAAWVTVNPAQHVLDDLSTGNPFIVRVDASGHMHRYTVPTPLNQDDLRAIVSGPDDALWFPEPTGVGRISTRGQVREYAIDLPNGVNVDAAAFGPGGNLFVRTGSGLHLVRVSTSTGTVTVYPSVRREIDWFQPLSDGSTVFLQRGRVRGKPNLYRVQPSGAITSVTLPHGIDTNFVTTNSNGSFATTLFRSGGNQARVIRFSVSGKTSIFTAVTDAAFVRPQSSSRLWVQSSGTVGRGVRVYLLRI